MPLLDFIANLAFEAEGAAALLKLPDVFETLLSCLEPRVFTAARDAAALALRNLAFTTEGRVALLAKPCALPALLDALHLNNMQLAARAGATLWALLAKCERAKGAIRQPFLLAQLRAAEVAFATRAMVAAPWLDAERELLSDCLCAVGAMMSILDL